MSRVLTAFIGPHRVGALIELEGGMWSFEYDQNWLDTPDRYALAPGLPLQRDPIVDTGSRRPVTAWLKNLWHVPAIRGRDGRAGIYLGCSCAAVVPGLTHCQ